MADGTLSERKIFSYGEAAEILPEVRRITEEAYQKVDALSSSGADTRALDEVVTAWAHAIMEMGVEVKGLWLVDFDNGSGYYCWRYPEATLQYYHTYESGFGGRMRIQ